MNIAGDEKKHVARYLSFLSSCEMIAHSCSARQAKLCGDSRMKKFLLRQSRQEKFHALTFQSGILFLAPKGVCTPALKHTQRYNMLLDAALTKHDLLSSVIGLQVILEGMGEVALSRLDFGMTQRDLGFKKLRRAILSQEDAHYDFGLHYINATPSSTLAPRSEAYLGVIAEMLSSLQGLFDFFDEDSEQYQTDFRLRLPEQLYNHALSHHTHS